MTRTNIRPAMNHGKAFSPKTASGRNLELDGFPGLAILPVIICHYIANASLPRLGLIADRLKSFLDIGWRGVDLFFAVSGCLIGVILPGPRSSQRDFGSLKLSVCLGVQL
jgi:peptidoglycan/LPS O-acetylase OafA/YrhL